MDILIYFESLIQNKNLDLNLFVSFYEKEEYQSLFDLCLENDLVDIVKFLYENFDVKFYLEKYIKNMDKNFFDELNNENRYNNKSYRIQIKSGYNDSYKYLLYNRRYSKMFHDEKGFYYKFK